MTHHPDERSGHIFLSYQHEDRSRAAALARALQRRGWPVWWDREIRAGQTFRRVISEALRTADCVIALWTVNSIESEWVQEEAQDGKQRGILVPAVLDDVPQPLGFRQVQAASLVGWNGRPDDPTLDDLLAAVAALYRLDHVPPLGEVAEEVDVGGMSHPAPKRQSDGPGFCRKCGTETITGTRYCRNCGHDLTT